MYTLEHYNALTEAIATGALTITYGGKQLTYRSLKEMRSLRDEMAVQLGLIKKSPRRKYGDFHKGTYKDD